jgi:hypothetical protein
MPIDRRSPLLPSRKPLARNTPVEAKYGFSRAAEAAALYDNYRKETNAR